jgi:hypothetical protein
MIAAEFEIARCYQRIATALAVCWPEVLANVPPGLRSGLRKWG